MYSGGIKNVPQPDPIIRTHPYRNGTEQINYDVYDEMEERHMAQCLEGIRVLDIATVIAAPFAAGLLADFGAEFLSVGHRWGATRKQSHWISIMKRARSFS